MVGSIVSTYSIKCDKCGIVTSGKCVSSEVYIMFFSSAITAEMFNILFVVKTFKVCVFSETDCYTRTVRMYLKKRKDI